MYCSKEMVSSAATFLVKSVIWQVIWRLVGHLGWQVVEKLSFELRNSKMRGSESQLLQEKNDLYSSFQKSSHKTKTFNVCRTAVRLNCARD